MGLFKFLKEKIAKKNVKETETYVSGMSKSRENFANKLDELSKRYKEVNQEYFENLEEILIEADVGVSLTLRIIEEVIEEFPLKARTELRNSNNIDETYKALVEDLKNRYNSMSAEDQKKYKNQVLKMKKDLDDFYKSFKK